MAGPHKTSQVTSQNFLLLLPVACSWSVTAISAVARQIQLVGRKGRGSGGEAPRKIV